MTEQLQTLPGARAINFDMITWLKRTGQAGALAGALVTAACGGDSTPSNNAASTAPASASGSTSPKTCPEDPKNASAADVDANNPTLVFSWLCGGSTVVNVYHGPFDTDADRAVAGTYYGVESEPGKNVASAKCFVTNGRSVPSHPERGELDVPASTHWVETEAGTWAPETYTFNGALLEKVISECTSTQLPPD